MKAIRVITAAALFDGHDVSINIFRKLLLKRGAEVIHLGHNRSVSELVTVALQEDVDAILVSSYQGGHNEYFKYVIDRLREFAAGHVLLFGGGGGVILPEEIRALEKYGVERIYHALDGQRLGIDGIADDMIARISRKRKRDGRAKVHAEIPAPLSYDGAIATLAGQMTIARQLSFFENNLGNSKKMAAARQSLREHDRRRSLVLGFTGTGGSGKSSLIDELIGRFLKVCPGMHIGVLSVDPTRKSTGGALLGDRIRFNSIIDPRVYFRSLATRRSDSEVSLVLHDAIALLKAYGFELIIVETSGIGQGDSRILEFSDHSVYVMTAEYGAPTQLDKIEMLDLARFIVINKYEKSGSQDALREVTLNTARNRGLAVSPSRPAAESDLPIYGTCCNHFNDPGVNRLFKDLLQLFAGGTGADLDLLQLLPTQSDPRRELVAGGRTNYLAEIAAAVQSYHDRAFLEARQAGACFGLAQSLETVTDPGLRAGLQEEFDRLWQELPPASRKFIQEWDGQKKRFAAATYRGLKDGKEVEIPLYNLSLAGLHIPKVALPRYRNWEDLLLFAARENLPGYFPYTAGVFPFKKTSEEPKRQFAGEGSAMQTNRRFHFLTAEDSAKRLSVAFDGITLYGEDPSLEPDIYGKIGESGVSISTIDDMDTLFSGFNLTDALTSVSMTINAPAPIILAMYFMVAYRRELRKLEAAGQVLTEAEKEQLRIGTFRRLRGTVQADILKEDQGQNTCIFSIDFAMKLIGDVQEFFSSRDIRNYYSLSVSGYHIAEAGANPISQLAFTLANGFTYVEYFLSRGLKIDEFAPNLSFFFSNGMEPEYSVIGRVARRIWAIAIRDRYRGSEKSQRLKYHIQTSGRSLHAQEIHFNDIRTTLQALLAFYDNCNSLHTNSYDEAVTTPTEESVRRSMAIQMILASEFGMLKNENPNQGSFIIDELTDLVEAAVLKEFERLSQRGGVLGAMEKQYQRATIQEESLVYEEMKQSGAYPVIGVNRFIGKDQGDPYAGMTITRCSREEKDGIIGRLRRFQEENHEAGRSALAKLRDTVLGGGNIFAELLHTVQFASLGQITRVLYETGGRYRRGV